MPILPKQRDIFPGDLLDLVGNDSRGPGRWLAPGLLTSSLARWIPRPDERMLGDDSRVIRRWAADRLIVAIRVLNQGDSIELEDVNLESL